MKYQEISAKEFEELQQASQRKQNQIAELMSQKAQLDSQIASYGGSVENQKAIHSANMQKLQKLEIQISSTKAEMDEIEMKLSHLTVSEAKIAEFEGFMSEMHGILEKYSHINGNKIDPQTMLVKTLPEKELFESDLAKEVCRTQCLEAFKDLYAKIEDVNAQDKNGMTLLMHTLSYGFVAGTEILLNDPGIDCNILDAKGQNALMYSALMPHIKCISTIIERTDNINLQKPETGSTAMHLLCKANILFTDEIIDKFGANVCLYMGGLRNVPHTSHKQDDSPMTLSFVLGYDNSNYGEYDFLQEKIFIILSKFIEHGGDLTIKNSCEEIDVIFNMLLNFGCRYLFNRTCSEFGFRLEDYKDQTTKSGLSLMHLSASNDLNLFKKLASEGGDINSKNENDVTPLYILCTHGVLENARELLSMGADPNIPSSQGFYPIHAAVHYSHQGIATQLLDYGSDVDQNSTSGISPFYYSIRFVSDTKLEMLDFLLGRGAKIDKPNDTLGFTALYAALDLEKPIELIEFLVEKGADVNKPISTGDTPIASASARGNVIVMQYLIDQGADINCSNQDGDVPIHEAFCSGNFDAIDLLLSLEANPNTQNNDGKTSLHWMLMNKSLDAQKKIAVIKKYSHICDFTLVDKDGKTPMDYAIEYCPEATVYLDTSLPLEANLFAQQEEAAIDIAGEIVLEDSTT